jgi:putative nucleotidyltransferase with HDIG domain
MTAPIPEIGSAVEQPQAARVAPECVAASDAPFADEVQAMRWVFDEVRAARPVPGVEAEAIVGSLLIEQLAAGRSCPRPLPLDEIGCYHAVHGINVARLAMALALELEFDAAAVRRIGVAALLHDVGMMRVPADLVAKPGQLSAEERERVKEHPVQGARALLAAGPSLELAAVVAYEHHLKVDGSGYPKLAYPRAAHYVSRLVQLCDVYHALCSPRPFRPPWPQEIIVSYLNERAGFEFHPALAASLTALLSRGPGQV